MAIIRIACNCGKSLKVDTVHAGKKVKCPDCGHLNVIPGDGAAASSSGAVPKTVPSPVKPAAPKPPVKAPAPPPREPEPAGFAMPGSDDAGADDGGDAGHDAGGFDLGQGGPGGADEGAMPDFAPKPAAKPPKAAPAKAAAAGGSEAAASEPADPNAPPPPAPVNKNATFYGLIAVIIGGALVGLFFAPLIVLKSTKPPAFATAYRANGLQIMLNQSDDTRTTWAGGFDKPEIKAAFKFPENVTPSEVILSRYVDTEWVSYTLYAYLGLAVLVTLVGLINWMVAPKFLAGKVFGVIMLISGLGCMGVIGNLVLREGKVPAELGETFAKSFAYSKGMDVMPAFVILGLGFMFFGFGVVYMLTSSVGGGGKGKSKPKPRIGGAPAPSGFEPPM